MASEGELMHHARVVATKHGSGRYSVQVELDGFFLRGLMGDVTIRQEVGKAPRLDLSLALASLNREDVEEVVGAPT